MRSKALWFIALSLVGVAILFFLLSQPSVVHDGPAPIPDASIEPLDSEPVITDEPHDPRDSDGDELTTSVDRPLQQRLATAFPASFKRGVDILWEPVDGWVSPEVFEWWAAHVDKDDVGGLTPEAAEPMFVRISDDASIFPRPDRRRICAVVGASRNLLGARYGDLIDAHDLVFRVNRAHTKSFRSDVGKKTTHHVMWPRDLEEWEYDREAYLLMTPVTASTKNVFDRILYQVDTALLWDPQRVRIIHPEFVKYLYEEWTEGRMAYPSTGFITLMLALSVCDEVDVFGFGADASGRWDRYYEDDPVDATRFHPADVEARLIQEMEENGILRTFRGDRSIPSPETDPSTQN